MLSKIQWNLLKTDKRNFVPDEFLINYYKKTSPKRTFLYLTEDGKSNGFPASEYTIFCQNEQNLFKADTPLKWTKFLKPEVSAVGKFHCKILTNFAIMN